MSPRRLAFLVCATGAWLLWAAAPALADGGPHIADVNSGTSSLTADSCAGCHRAHTAKGEFLLVESSPEALCLSCHNGLGATTDVVDGLQFTPSGWTGTPATDPVLGGLRGGGFTYALIDADNPARIKYGFSRTAFNAKVPVLAAVDRQPVTSTHHGSGTIWGNGPDGTDTPGAGPANLTCTTCHNPHGNGFYRILNPLVGQEFTGAVGGFVAAGQAVEVEDIPNPTNGTRNYTVLPGVLASDVISYGATAGDYWRKRLVWNVNSSGWDLLQIGWDGVSPTNAAANGNVPVTNANGLMTAWCVRCHTRYSGLVDELGNSSSRVPQPDAVFKYRHLTMNYGCLQCHVSHGSNALMDGPISLAMEDPSGVVPPSITNAGSAAGPVTSGGSRLLKVGGRGTCQLCHDPTGTIAVGAYTGPIPSPGAP